jgi:hypothetical protein
MYETLIDIRHYTGFNRAVLKRRTIVAEPKQSQDPKHEPKQNPDQGRKSVPTSLILGPEIIAKVRVLARGWDRTVSWTVRDLIDGALASHYSELYEFANRQAIEDVQIAKIKKKPFTGESNAQLVKRLLAEEKERNKAEGTKSL